MKKVLTMILFVFIEIVYPAAKADAQILTIITTAIKKVIVAIDLGVQQVQNKTIVLQEAQKELENVLSQLKLDEIGSWVGKSKDLYSDYFQELDKVKTIIANYHKVREITATESTIVSQYKSAYALFQQDSHFTPGELQYMYKVYSGILDESVKNIGQLSLVINSFFTQMTDEKRVNIIDGVARSVETNYLDLQQFNNQNKMISLQRSKTEGEINHVKALYGIE